MTQDFYRLLVAHATSTLAGKALTAVVGYQVFEQTESVLALGLLGLVEAIPALSLALYGGHIADRVNRRSILRVTLGVLVLCGIALAVIATLPAGLGSLLALYGVVFVAGVARGFADPAEGALEAQVVPVELQVKTAAWMGSAWLGCAVAAPVLAMIAYASRGPATTYAGISVLYAVAWLATARLGTYPMPEVPEGETVWQSIRTGLAYVWREPVLLGAMALDLFAVLFGGAIALLPAFAKDVLHIGKIEFGFLNAAPYAGALLALLWATRYPPVRHAGRNLLCAVAGFGVCMIVFALSTSYPLSLIALALSGVFDGVSVVIRKSILRLFSPDHLRGRIAAVNMIFVSSSNELGAFESGIAARFLGLVPSVWIGGIVTLLIVAMTAVAAPKLRSLRLDVVQRGKPPECT